MTPRRRLVLTGAACLAVGAAAGYLARPAPEVEERVRIVEAENFSSAEEWVTRRDAAEETHQVRVEEHGPVVTTWPDGRREERGPSRIVTGTDTRKVERVEVEVIREVEVERLVTVDVERIVRVESRPDWLLGAQVGAGSAGVMYGGQVSRRVLGPLYLTAGAMAGGGEWVATAGGGVAF